MNLNFMPRNFWSAKKKTEANYIYCTKCCKFIAGPNICAEEISQSCVYHREMLLIVSADQYEQLNEKEMEKRNKKFQDKKLSLS
jgi:hypothetical protein